MDISWVCGALHFDVFKMERLDGDVFDILLYRCLCRFHRRAFHIESWGMGVFRKMENFFNSVYRREHQNLK